MPSLSPYLLAVLSVIFYAALTAMAKKTLLTNVPPFAFMSLTVLGLFILSTSASLIFEKKFSLTQLHWPEWRALLLFVIINFASFSLYLIAIQKMPTAHYQLIFAISPIITATLAYFLLGETIQPKFFVGLLFVGAGLYIALAK